jgi:rhomboid protease GluP
MPKCLRCGAELPVNEEGLAPVLCDRCAGAATSRARKSLSAVGTMHDFPATTALVAINLAVYVYMLVSGGNLMGLFSHFSGDHLIRNGGNYGPLTLNGEYWRLLTAGFVHSDLLHIGFNMWCLWSLGQLSERLFGRWITVAVYLLTGVAGAMLSIGYDPNRLEVGASGAIFGIAGAILSGIKFGNVAVSPMQKRSIFSSLIFFVIFNLAIGVGPGIDNMCHLGGLIAGFIFGVPLATASASGKKSFEWATIVLAALVLAVLGRQVVDTRAPQARNALASIAVEALKEHDYPFAIKWFERLTADSADTNLYAALGYAYQMNHEEPKAVAAYQHALQLDPNNEQAKQALAELQGDGNTNKPQ